MDLPIWTGGRPYCFRDVIQIHFLINQDKVGTYHGIMRSSEKEILIGAIEPLAGESVVTGQFAATHNETSFYHSIGEIKHG